MSMEDVNMKAQQNMVFSAGKANFAKQEPLIEISKYNEKESEEKSLRQIQSIPPEKVKKTFNQVRYSIVDQQNDLSGQSNFGGAMNQNMVNIVGPSQTVGRRIDQVQNRRRRIK